MHLILYQLLKFQITAQFPSLEFITEVIICQLSRGDKVN